MAMWKPTMAVWKPTYGQWLQPGVYKTREYKVEATNKGLKPTC